MTPSGPPRPYTVVRERGGPRPAGQRAARRRQELFIAMLRREHRWWQGASAARFYESVLHSE